MKEKWIEFREKNGCYLSPALFLFSLLLLDFGFRVVHSFVSQTGVWDLAPCLFTLFWSLLLTGIVCLIPGLAKRIVMGVIVGLFLVFALANAILYHVSSSFFSLGDLAFAEDGMSFLSFQYFTIDWRIYLTVFVSAFLCVFAIHLAPAKQRYSKLPLTLCLALILTSFTGNVLVHSHYDEGDLKEQFWWTDTYTPGSMNAVYTEFTSPNDNLMFCGLYQYLYRSISVNLGDYFHLDSIRSELDAYYSARSDKTVPNEMTGVLKDRNLVAVMMESIDTWMINEEMMPNLYALQKESVNFNDFYTPMFLNSGTFNTEAAFNIGLYLPVSGTGAQTYATNSYPQSLPHLFRNAGYAANSYHNLEGRFYNRQVVHPQWGYEAFHDFGAMNLKGNHDLDSSLMEAYSMFCPKDTRYFSYIITYSGHGPYDNPESEIAAPHMAEALAAAKKSGILAKTEDTWNQFVIAIAHAMETDALIGSLVEQMRTDGTLENTDLILFGDHYCKYLTDTEFVMELKGAHNENTLCKTPMMIYSQKLAAENVERIGSSIDLLPTIANLYGLEYNPRYVLGRDLFGDEEGIVCFRDYAWIDENRYWEPGMEDPLSEKEEEQVQKVRQLLTVSWNTVKCNYFQNVTP